jgi:hypothetical protein
MMKPPVAARLKQSRNHDKRPQKFNTTSFQRNPSPSNQIQTKTVDPSSLQRPLENVEKQVTTTFAPSTGDSLSINSSDKKQRIYMSYLVNII